MLNDDQTKTNSFTLRVKVRLDLPQKFTAQQISVHIPLPQNVARYLSVHTNFYSASTTLHKTNEWSHKQNQTATVNHESYAVEWNLNNFAGGNFSILLIRVTTWPSLTFRLF